MSLILLTTFAFLAVRVRYQYVASRETNGPAFKCTMKEWLTKSTHKSALWNFTSLGDSQVWRNHQSIYRVHVMIEPFIPLRFVLRPLPSSSGVTSLLFSLLGSDGSPWGIWLFLTVREAVWQSHWGVDLEATYLSFSPSSASPLLVGSCVLWARYLSLCALVPSFPPTSTGSLILPVSLGFSEKKKGSNTCKAHSTVPGT